jgi:dTDP-4-dehydrorhamnose reductase
LDLLCGRVERKHPLYGYLTEHGASERELAELHDAPCPPDIIGVNYYVTSERFLDENVERYPPRICGGNGRDAYADVEAVRVCREGLIGPRKIIESVYERLRRPIAVTEIHMGCSVEQQKSWLDFVVGEAMTAAEHGVPLTAVTVWALLGAFGWDQLVTRPRGRYEPGAFELVNGNVRPTALAEQVRALGRGERPQVEPGWWTLPSRLYPEQAAPVREARVRSSQTTRV